MYTRNLIKEENIKLIIFDYDGVIYNIVDPLREIVIEGVKKYNLKSNGLQEDMREIFRVLEFALSRSVSDQILDSKEMFDIKLLEGYTQLKRLRIGTHFYGAYRERTKEPKLFEGVEELINELHKRKIKIAILSNSAKKYIVETMKQYNLHSKFSTILGAADVSQVKPDPEGLLKILKIEKINAKNTLFIGDMISDIEAGKNAGIKTIAIASGIIPREKLEKNKPLTVIDNISEFSQLLGI